MRLTANGTFNTTNLTQKNKQMATLQLTHYGRKGIYAYLSAVEVDGTDIKRGAFVNGSPIADDENNYHRGKASTVEFDLAKFADGWYEWKEASGHKASSGFFRLKNGEIVERCDSKTELVDLLNPVPELPELEGSDRQVSWAEQIRATAIRGGFPAKNAAKYTTAKTWIDNRSKLTKYGVKA
jgi:hypothetical protein